MKKFDIVVGYNEFELNNAFQIVDIKNECWYQIWKFGGDVWKFTRPVYPLNGHEIGKTWKLGRNKYIFEFEEICWYK